MKKKYATYLIWLSCVILWNYLYPHVEPIYDVIAAVFLSIMTKFLNKLNLF